ncbi:hypothetical protein CEXT_169071 [Caerostris extrusa]|uniref:Uncharacterized protein n=1 Tax=Caerostris extrusa TaxID=172846 RepID=A0AAV4XNU1_CAEEX|nr:hypothetical protein CEXT_169071 [Caerostris extrusa]
MIVSGLGLFNFRKLFTPEIFTNPNRSKRNSSNYSTLEKYSKRMEEGGLCRSRVGNEIQVYEGDGKGVEGEIVHSVNGSNNSKINSFDSDKTGCVGFGWEIPGYYVDEINATCSCVCSKSLQNFCQITEHGTILVIDQQKQLWYGSQWQWKALLWWKCQKDLAETNNKTQPAFLVSFLEKRFHEDLDLRD